MRHPTAGLVQIEGPGIEDTDTRQIYMRKVITGVIPRRAHRHPLSNRVSPKMVLMLRLHHTVASFGTKCATMHTHFCSQHCSKEPNKPCRVLSASTRYIVQAMWQDVSNVHRRIAPTEWSHRRSHRSPLSLMSLSSLAPPKY
jgi:hypothetical protein